MNSLLRLLESPQQTLELGRRLGATAPPAMMITLAGPLGAGKTLLAKGFAGGLGVDSEVHSPTFTLATIHAGRVPLMHVDTYRMKSSLELIDLELDQAIQDGTIVLLEWPDDLFEQLPPVDLAIDLQLAPQETRLARLVAHTDPAKEWLDRVVG